SGLFHFCFVDLRGFLLGHASRDAFLVNAVFLDELANFDLLAVRAAAAEEAEDAAVGDANLLDLAGVDGVRRFLGFGDAEAVVAGSAFAAGARSGARRTGLAFDDDGFAVAMRAVIDRNRILSLGGGHPADREGEAKRGKVTDHSWILLIESVRG